MKVAGTTVVVTGGGDGIGRALVLGLLDRGARVAAVGRTAAHLQETVAVRRRYRPAVRPMSSTSPTVRPSRSCRRPRCASTTTWTG